MFASKLTSSKPIIEVPAKLTRRLEKVRKRRTENQETWFRARNINHNNRLIISCKRKDLNHYEGQRYPRNIMELVSQHWSKSKHAGDYFTIMRYGKNPSLLPSEFEDVSFSDFGLAEEVIRGLNACQCETPTLIQKLAIPTIIKGRNCLFAAETGSGKTLTYAAPLLHRLLQLRRTHDLPVAGLPRALVLTPSRELADQTSLAVKRFAQFTNINVHLSVSGKDSVKPLEPFQDIIVGTPGVLMRLVRSGFLKLDSISTVVVDESDSLLDDSFSNIVFDLLRPIKIQIQSGSDLMPGAQLLLSTATMPQEVDLLLEALVNKDNLDVIASDYIHRLQPHVAQKFIRSTKPELPERFLRIMKKEMKTENRILVFTNETRSCFWVNEFLQSNGIPSRALHGGLRAEERRAVYEEFVNDRLRILISTDIGSRGLDTNKISHVINYDFPRHISDYIHRCGRVGRVGGYRFGHVTSFVSAKEDIPLVQIIEEAARKESSLPNVDANIARKIDEKNEEIEYHQPAETL